MIKAQSATPAKDSHISKSHNSVVASRSSGTTRNKSAQSVDYQQSFANLQVLVLQELHLSNIIKSLQSGQLSPMQKLQDLEELITSE